MPAGTTPVVSNITPQFTKSFGTTFGTAVPINLAALGVNVSFVSGTGAINTYQTCYAATLTLSTSPTSLNLTSGALTQPDGTAAVFADIVCMVMRNNGTAGQTVTVGGGSNAMSTIWGATGTEKILPGANNYMLKLAPFVTGFVVTASTADILTVVAASGTPTLDIVLLGH